MFPHLLAVDVQDDTGDNPSTSTTRGRRQPPVKPPARQTELHDSDEESGSGSDWSHRSKDSEEEDSEQIIPEDDSSMEGVVILGGTSGPSDETPADEPVFKEPSPVVKKSKSKLVHIFYQFQRNFTEIYCRKIALSWNMVSCSSLSSV